MNEIWEPEWYENEVREGVSHEIIWEKFISSKRKDKSKVHTAESSVACSWNSRDSYGCNKINIKIGRGGDGCGS